MPCRCISVRAAAASAIHASRRAASRSNVVLRAIVPAVEASTRGAHALGPRQRVLEAGPAAHRLRHQTDVAEPEMLDQRREVAGVVGRVGPARDFARRGETAVGEGHAGMAGGEMRYLLPPAEMIAAEPVGEDDRRPFAGHLVVQAAAGAIEPAAFGWRR